MLFYSIVVIVTTLLGWIYCHSKGIFQKITFILLVSIPGLIAGLRGVGTDYIGYRQAYISIINSEYFYVDYSSLLIQFIRKIGEIGLPFQFSIFVISFSTVAITFWAIGMFKNEISFTFAVFSYMLQFYFLSYNLFRQMLAVALYMLAVTYKAKYNDEKKFWIFGIAAGLIHSSSIPFLMIYFVWNIITKYRFGKARILIYIIGISGIMLIPLLVNQTDFLRSLFPHYENYFREFTYLGFGFGILRYFLLADIPSFYERLKDKEIYNSVLSFLPFVSVFGMIVSCLSYISNTFLYRISYYLLVFLPIYHGYLFRQYKLKRFKVKRGFFLIPIISITLLFFFIYDILVLKTGDILPYKFFWE